MLYADHLILVLVCLLVPSGGKGENGFNCEAECGMYTKNDKVAPLLHEGCKAMTESEKCQKKFVEKKRKRSRKKKIDDSRIVGGEVAKDPMPWMAFIEIGEESCGGTLINSQFILSAAHCFCNGQLGCTSNIGYSAAKPIIVEDKTISDRIKISLGMTVGGGVNLWPPNLKKEEKDGKLHYKNSSFLFFSAEKIFIHPLLGSAQEFLNSPDQALVKMDGRVDSFKEHIRPICLATQDVDDKPFCPDNSKDRKATEKEKKAGKSVGDDHKLLGGCATVAGWGHRYSGEQKYADASCRTNFANKSPHKIGFCSMYWTVKGEEYSNCTTKSIPVNDLAKPCRLLTQELAFQNKLNKTNPTVDKFVDKSDAPLQLRIKTRKKVITRYCGKINFQTKDTKPGGILENGWCATKLDKRDKIETYGFCTSTCTDDRKGFMFANLNILTDEECEKLFKYQVAKDKSSDMSWNREYEICTGKKHVFPKSAISLLRKRKKKKVNKEEEEKAKKLGIKGWKPTKYTYQPMKDKIEQGLGTPRDYEFDWFLGDVDSCQGDSGGPLWRNIEDSSGTMRATQIGTVSRGHGCAGFNSPAVFGSVKMSFDWIKEVVEKEMKKEEFCPQK